MITDRSCRGAHPQLADRDRSSSSPGPGPHRYVRAHAPDGPGVERADVVVPRDAAAADRVRCRRPRGRRCSRQRQIGQPGGRRGTARWVSSSGAPPRSAASGQPLESEAFSVQFAKPEDEHLYWRAAVYDDFDLTAWQPDRQRRVRRSGRRRGARARAPTRSTETGRRAGDVPGLPDRLPWLVDRVAAIPAEDRYAGPCLVRRRREVPRHASTARAAIPTRSRPWSGSAATTRMGRSRSTVSARPGPPTRRRSASTTSRCPRVRSRRAATRRSSSRTSLPRSRTRTTRTTSRARWSTTCSRPPTSSTTPTSATWPARACRPSSASPGTAMATASTTRRRWRSCSASTASRRAWLPGSCPANAMTRALRARVGQRGTRLGRGLLPRVRLGGVRPDGRWPCRSGAAADRRTGP